MLGLLSEFISVYVGIALVALIPFGINIINASEDCDSFLFKLPHRAIVTLTVVGGLLWPFACGVLAAITIYFIVKMIGKFCFNFVVGFGDIWRFFIPSKTKLPKAKVANNFKWNL